MQGNTRPFPNSRCEILGPADGAVVEAWADDYIRFERRPVWQEQLRTEIRSCCRHLDPSAEQVLHATFFGRKLPNADVENVLLYYIDSFNIAGRGTFGVQRSWTCPLPRRNPWHGFFVA